MSLEFKVKNDITNIVTTTEGSKIGMDWITAHSDEVKSTVTSKHL